MLSRSSTARSIPAFQTAAIAGSLDGEFYRQDKLTVLAGKLPPASSTSASDPHPTNWPPPST